MAARLRSRGLFAAADSARDRGDWPEAVLGFERLCRVFPLSAALHVQRGNMLKESTRLSEAQQAYDVARWLEPTLADVWLQIGHLAKMQDRPGEAAAAYRRSSELDPDRPDAARELASLYALNEDEWASAENDWAGQSSSARPRMPRARFASASASTLAFERLKVALSSPVR